MYLENSVAAEDGLCEAYACTKRRVWPEVACTEVEAVYTVAISCSAILESILSVSAKEVGTHGMIVVSYALAVHLHVSQSSGQGK